jgi:hypothetical protein
VAGLAACFLGVVGPAPGLSAQASDAPGGVVPASSCPEPEARAFDFWIGEWDVANHTRPAGGEWARTGDATDRVYAVAGGCAVVEHWRGYAFPGAGHIAGFSVRAWNPRTTEWDLVLLWPIGRPPSFGHLRGSFEDGVGRFYNRFVNPQGDTVRIRLSFDEIGPDSFVWYNGSSTDGGESWTSTWRMEFARRPLTAAGLLNGPAMTPSRCPAPAHRAFDDHLGEWTGVRVNAGGDSVAVRTTLTRILDGCAVMQRMVPDGGNGAVGFESFAVRAWEPDPGRWVEYAVDPDRPGLVRREGESARVFTDTEPVDGSYRRTRWELDDRSATVVEEEAPAPDGPWRRVHITRLVDRVGS